MASIVSQPRGRLSIFMMIKALRGIRRRGGTPFTYPRYIRAISAFARFALARSALWRECACLRLLLAW